MIGLSSFVKHFSWFEIWDIPDLPLLWLLAINTITSSLFIKVSFFCWNVTTQLTMISWQNTLSVSVSWIDFHLRLTQVQLVGEGNASWGIWNAYHCIVGDLAVGEQQCIACLIWCLSTMPLVHYKACLSSSYQTPPIPPFATQIIILTLNIFATHIWVLVPLCALTHFLDEWIVFIFGFCFLIN